MPKRDDREWLVLAGALSGLAICLLVLVAILVSFSHWMDATGHLQAVVRLVATH